MDRIKKACNKEASFSEKDDGIHGIIKMPEFSAEVNKVGSRGYDFVINVKQSDSPFEDLTVANELNRRTDGRFFFEDDYLKFAIFAPAESTDEDLKLRIAILKIESDRFIKSASASKADIEVMYR